LNEEVDPTLIIRRLKAEIRDLKEEVRLLRGEEEVRGPLTPDEVVRLQKQVRATTAVL
jgi:kinesin family protein 6/9